jgi:microcystin degradation protein MlrC
VAVPVIIPGERGITAAEPLKTLYARLPEIAKQEGLMDASIFVGMPWTDVERAGMSVQVVARDSSYRGKAKAEACSLAARLWEKRMDLRFDVPACGINEAIQRALDRPEKSVFITDSGDNTTAGAAGDNPGVLEKLLAHGVKSAVFAGIHDPEALRACEKAGAGRRVVLTLGSRTDPRFGKPLRVEGIVEFVTPAGVDEPPGSGSRRAAVVDVDGIRVVVLATRRSFTSPADFAEVRVDPLASKIVVVKCGYLFQALRDIAPYTIMALTPGYANQNLIGLPYERVRRPIFPLDPDMSWSPPVE